MQGELLSKATHETFTMDAPAETLTLNLKVIRGRKGESDLKME